MTSKKNAAQVAAQAEPCPDFKSDQVVDARLQAQQDCKRIFGEFYPEEVISPIHRAAETLYWLGQVFDTIAADPKASARIKSLADVGAYLAGDVANISGAYFEKMQAAMKKGGAA